MEGGAVVFGGEPRVQVRGQGQGDGQEEEAVEDEGADLLRVERAEDQVERDPVGGQADEEAQESRQNPEQSAGRTARAQPPEWAAGANVDACASASGRTPR